MLKLHCAGVQLVVWLGRPHVNSVYPVGGTSSPALSANHGEAQLVLQSAHVSIVLTLGDTSTWPGFGRVPNQAERLGRVLTGPILYGTAQLELLSMGFIST